MTPAEQLLRYALRDAVWNEKIIHGGNGSRTQSWSLTVYLHYPAGADVSAEQALDLALNDGKPTYDELLEALRDAAPLVKAHDGTLEIDRKVSDLLARAGGAA
jgi:hypothetical protein